MKSTLLGGVAAIAMFAAAGGATPVAAQEPFDWTGMYFGGHVGYGEADYDGGRGILDVASDGAILAGDLDLDGLADSLRPVELARLPQPLGLFELVAGLHQRMDRLRGFPETRR